MLLAESPPEAPLICTLGRATRRRSWWMPWLLQASLARRKACLLGRRLGILGLEVSGSSRSAKMERRGGARPRRACQAPASARSLG